jgi:hypothetical protein
MSRQSHQTFLEKSALREAQKAFSRDKSGATLRGFCSLRIQTVEPWKRAVCVLVGLALGGLALWSHSQNFNVWLTLFFASLAVFSALAGALGWKRPVDVILEATAEVLFRRVLDAL